MPNSWLFQGNPDTFDIDGYLMVTQDVLWEVRQAFHASRMSIGDRVFLWRAAGKSKAVSGIIASGFITEPPSIRPEDEPSRPFWKSSDRLAPVLRVPVHVDNRAVNNKETIKADALKNDPVLRDLLILRMANQTNYLLPQPHAIRLASLWERVGVTWSRPEAIAGLWVYAKTYGQSISENHDSVVAKVAVRIGRTVPSVYNKVMNFRAMDPRDSRTGLPGAGGADKQVWDTYFDASNGSIRMFELDEEFRNLWGSLHEPFNAEALELSKIPTEQARKGRPVRSQGYQLDSRVRRVVELRAMEVAKEHYRNRSFDVEDVSAIESYDLRCTKGSDEFLVEVKGTGSVGERIMLTANEVRLAQSGAKRIDLFIVSNIEVLRSPEGPQAIGGQARVIESWKPLNEHLEASAYYYTVPI